MEDLQDSSTQDPKKSEKYNLKDMVDGYTGSIEKLINLKQNKDLPDQSELSNTLKDHLVIIWTLLKKSIRDDESINITKIHEVLLYMEALKIETPQVTPLRKNTMFFNKSVSQSPKQKTMADHFKETKQLQLPEHLKTEQLLFNLSKTISLPVSPNDYGMLDPIHYGLIEGLKEGNYLQFLKAEKNREDFREKYGQPVWQCQYPINKGTQQINHQVFWDEQTHYVDTQLEEQKKDKGCGLIKILKKELVVEDLPEINRNQYIIANEKLWYFNCEKPELITLKFLNGKSLIQLSEDLNFTENTKNRSATRQELDLITSYTGHTQQKEIEAYVDYQRSVSIYGLLPKTNQDAADLLIYLVEGADYTPKEREQLLSWLKKSGGQKLYSMITSLYSAGEYTNGIEPTINKQDTINANWTIKKGKIAIDIDSIASVLFNAETNQFIYAGSSDKLMYNNDPEEVFRYDEHNQRIPNRPLMRLKVTIEPRIEERLIDDKGGKKKTVMVVAPCVTALQAISYNKGLSKPKSLDQYYTPIAKTLY